MITGLEMVGEFARNTRVLKRNLEGIDRDRALVRMSGGGNSINWLVGHLLRSRLDMLEQLGRDISELRDRLDPYRRARDEGYQDSELLALDELISLWDRAGEQLAEELPDARMESDDERFETLGKAILFYSFHEAYHIGQTGILRRAVGLEGQIR